MVGVDISTEAIRQLINVAVTDGTIDRILPVIADAEKYRDCWEIKNIMMHFILVRLSI